jgi:hypothetical protein
MSTQGFYQENKRRYVMSVYIKLNLVRIELQSSQLAKSGHNKFAGYKYFELGDFMPTVNTLFNKHKLCGVVSFVSDLATLTITDAEDGSQVVITSPMGSANLKGCHEVQNIGAVETYQRRYLWVAALEIVEHDVLDNGSIPIEPPKKVEQPKPAPVVAPPVVKEVAEKKENPWKIVVTPAPEGDAFEWFEAVNSAAEVALGFAQTGADVLAIFKENKSLFDKVKELDKSVFDVMMEKFTETKSKLQGK